MKSADSPNSQYGKVLILARGTIKSYTGFDIHGEELVKKCRILEKRNFVNKHGYCSELLTSLFALIDYVDVVYWEFGGIVLMEKNEAKRYVESFMISDYDAFV